MNHINHDPNLAKRSRISIACNSCRKKKIRCDGLHPCANCKSSLAECDYAPPKKRGRKSQDVVALATDHLSDNNKSSSLVSKKDPLNDMGTLLVHLEESTGTIQTVRSIGSSSGIRHFFKHANGSSGDVVFIRCPDQIASSSPSYYNVLPPLDLSLILIEFYFDVIHPTLPILNKRKVLQDLHSPNPPFFLFNAIFTASSFMLECYTKSLSDFEIAERPSDMFFTRAKLNLSDAIIGVPTLENLQAIIILTLVQSNGVTSGGYLLCGLAVRMAQDMGMTRKMDSFKDRVSTTLYRSHAIKKAIWAVFVLDKFFASSLGRAMALNSDELDVDLPSESVEAEVMASFLTNDDPLTAESITKLAMRHVSDFKHLIKLSDILGKILQNLYSLKKQAKINFCVTHLHQALSTFFYELPQHLHFSFTPVNGQSSNLFSAFLNMMYYTTVSLLYRPLVVSVKTSKSPRYQEYVNVCRVAAQAIIGIATQKLQELVLLPTFSQYLIFTGMISLTILKPIDEAHGPSIKTSMGKLLTIFTKLEIFSPAACNMKQVVVGLLQEEDTPRQMKFVRTETNYMLTSVTRIYDQQAIDTAYATVYRIKEAIDLTQVDDSNGATIRINKMQDVDNESSDINSHLTCLSSDTENRSHSNDMSTSSTIATNTAAVTSISTETDLVSDLITRTANMPSKAPYYQYSTSASSLTTPNPVTPDTYNPYKYDLQPTLSTESCMLLNGEVGNLSEPLLTQPNVPSLTAPPSWSNANSVFSNNTGILSDGSTPPPPVITAGRSPNVSTGPMLMHAISLSGQESLGNMVLPDLSTYPTDAKYSASFGIDFDSLSKFAEQWVNEQ